MRHDDLFVPTGQVDLTGVAHHGSLEGAQKVTLALGEEPHQLGPKDLAQAIVFGVRVEGRHGVLWTKPDVGMGLFLCIAIFAIWWRTGVTIFRNVKVVT